MEVDDEAEWREEGTVRRERSEERRKRQRRRGFGRRENDEILVLSTSSFSVLDFVFTVFILSGRF